MALEDISSILDNALGIAYVALLGCNSAIRPCLEIRCLFLGLPALLAYEVTGAIRVALEKLDPILESVLSKGQVAFLGLDSTLYDCLVCLTKRLGQIPCCLVYSVVCHCIFLPCLSRSCLRGIIITVLVRLREPVSLKRVFEFRLCCLRLLAHSPLIFVLPRRWPASIELEEVIHHLLVLIQRISPELQVGFSCRCDGVHTAGGPGL